MANETLYIKAERNIEVTGPDIYLSDVAKVTCVDKTIVNRVKAIKLYKFKKNAETRVIVSILKVIELIQEIYPNVTVSSEGEKEIVIELLHGADAKQKQQQKQHKGIGLATIMKIIFVACVSFFGTAFTIMAFHNDIGIAIVFGNIYRMITGDFRSGFSTLEITYSIGLALGIILFFNHLGGRRITKDPTPIEVEMRLYEEDVNKTLVETSDREGKTIDVD